MDTACLPALALLRVTTHVMELGQRVAAGDLDARCEVEALDKLLGSVCMSNPEHV